MSKADDTFIALARARWAQAEEADREQRERERADLRFYAGDQWDPAAIKARQAQQAQGTGVGALVPVPARPTLVINKVREPVHQVTNQERSSDFGVELVAADDFGDLDGEEDETEIELREGLNRRIQRAPEAEDARLWAGSRAVISGRGYYGVMTRYLPGKTNDQEIYVRLFFNQFSVSGDPARVMPDGSDAAWWFVGVEMPIEEYEAEYGEVDGKKNAITSSMSDDEWRALGNEAPTWFTGEGKTRTIRVVEYWHTELESRVLCTMPDGSLAWQDELPEDSPKPAETRRVVERVIKFCKLDGLKKLEETDWPGPDMPIIEVLGEQLHPYDSKKHAEGIVRPMRDSGQAFNASVSKFVETIGYSPIPPWQATPAQIQGFEQMYQLSSTRAIPVLYYNDVSDAGGRLERPTRTPAGSDVQALALAIQIFDEAIQSTSMVPEARVGRNENAKLKSGKALTEARESSEQSTSHFLENLKRSIRYEGQIINGLLYPLYGRKQGRLTRILTPEGEMQSVMINAAPTQMMGKKPPKVYTLSEHHKANVVVKVSRSYDTRRQQEVSTIAELLGANPLFMTWFGDLFFKNQDGPGHAEMAERAKVMLDPKIQAMLDAKKQGEPDPVQLAQAVEQLKAQLGEAEQLLQQAHAEIKGKLAEKQADNDVKMQIAELDARRDVLLQEMRDKTAVQIALIGAAAKGAALDAAAEQNALKLGDSAEQAERERQHQGITQAQTAGQQAIEAERGRRHEAGMAAAGGAVESDEAEAQRQHDQAMAEQGHAQNLEAQEQAAALAPQPEPEA